MRLPELSGLVLTHNSRDPSAAIESLSAVCGQIVAVHDRRFPVFDFSLLDLGDSELTVIERDFDSFPRQRNAGIDAASGEWILSVDSDEILSDKLAKEISELEPSSDDIVYAFPRVERFKGRRLRLANPSGLLSPTHARLFRSMVRYADEPLVHERFIDQESYHASVLNGWLEHFPQEGWLELWKKAFAYGRLRGPASMQLHGAKRKDILTNLAAYVAEDGIGGIAMSGAVVAYALGSKSSAVVKPSQELV